MVPRLWLCGAGERGQPEPAGGWDGQRGDALGAAGVSGLGSAGSGGVAGLPAGGGAGGGGSGVPAALLTGATARGTDVAVGERGGGPPVL